MCSLRKHLPELHICDCMHSLPDSSSPRQWSLHELPSRRVLRPVWSDLHCLRRPLCHLLQRYQLCQLYFSSHPRGRCVSRLSSGKVLPCWCLHCLRCRLSDLCWHSNNLHQLRSS